MGLTIRHYQSKLNGVTFKFTRNLEKKTEKGLENGL